jgi:starch-binding outer membrane protein, SusD/RagB family
MSFQTVWTSNQTSTWNWTADALTQFDRTSDITTATSVAKNDVAIKFCKPQESNYATEVADKLKKPYLWVDINDVYNEKSVKMTYDRVNRTPGNVTNPFIKFYPSLKKFNNGCQYQTTNTTRFTSDASAIVMRIGEIYLIAAEAEFYLNGATATAAGYINSLRTRAFGAGLGQITASNISLQFILDERARELCGEYTRWYDLKRTGKLNYNYLNDKNPDVGQYFKDGIHEVRPIPQSQIDAISNPEGFQNNGY